MPVGTSLSAHWFEFFSHWFFLHCLFEATGGKVFSTGESGTVVLPFGFPWETWPGGSGSSKGTHRWCAGFPGILPLVSVPPKKICAVCRRQQKEEARGGGGDHKSGVVRRGGGLRQNKQGQYAHTQQHNATLRLHSTDTCMKDNSQHGWAHRNKLLGGEPSRASHVSNPSRVPTIPNFALRPPSRPSHGSPPVTPSTYPHNPCLPQGAGGPMTRPLPAPQPAP